jgi:cutinase
MRKLEIAISQQNRRGRLIYVIVNSVAADVVDAGLRIVNCPLAFGIDAEREICQHGSVRARNIAIVIGATAASWAQPMAIPLASAAGCPDVEVVFARGTTEDPGLGPTGDAFVQSLRPRLAGKSLEVYPVDYPATMDFPRAMDGIRDASNHIESMAANCPNTSIVLGGFSQGAAVAGFVTANVIPDGAPDGVPNPMSPDVAKHVAAVALFGKPNDRFMRAINQPDVEVGPLYADKTVTLCVPDDFVCSGGGDFNAHTQYVETGLVDQAATFTAAKIAAIAPPPAAAPAAPPAAALPAPAAQPHLPPPAAAPAPAPAAPAPVPAAPAPAAAAPAPAPAPSAAPPSTQGRGPGTILTCQTTCRVIGPE